MDLRGRVALVTGGGTGLGRAISHELAGRGAKLAIVYSRSEHEAVTTVGELRDAGTDAEAFQADVADGEAVRGMMARVLDRFGQVDVVINDAGTTKFVPFQDMEGVGDDDWDRIMGVNAKGPWLVARAAAASLKERQGSIVNIASTAAFIPRGSSLAYCVSKAAMVHLTTCLAIALAPEVRVNCVAPGLFLTRWNAGFSPDQIQAIEKRTPLGKTIALEDLARMTVEVAINDGMTGETVVVDGGFSRG